MKQEDSEVLSPLSASAGKHKGRRRRLQTLLLTSEDAVIQDKQQTQKGKRSHRVGCAVKQQYAAMLSLGVDDNQKQPLH